MADAAGVASGAHAAADAGGRAQAREQIEKLRFEKGGELVEADEGELGAVVGVDAGGALEVAKADGGAGGKGPEQLVAVELAAERVVPEFFGAGDEAAALAFELGV